MPWLLRLYLLGLLLSLLSALFGLLSFLGEPAPHPWPEACLPGRWADVSRGSPGRALPKALSGQAELRAHKAVGSYS